MKANELASKLFDGVDLHWTEKGIIEQVLCAYADSHDGLEEARDLNFFYPHPVRGELAILIAERCIQSYNEFNAVVMKCIVDCFSEDALYFFAREGSVAIYVRPVRKDVTLHRGLDFAHDEFTYDSGLQMFRIWWD